MKKIFMQSNSGGLGERLEENLSLLKRNGLQEEMAKKEEGQNKRFWRNIEIKDINSCWEWMKSKDRYGYGRIKVDHKTWITSRFAYKTTHGEITKGMCVCHTCDNPTCCNPNHLFLGTPKDNAQDSNKKGRRATGSMIHKRKLKLEDIIKLKKMCGKITQCKIAERFKVSQSTVSKLKNIEIPNNQ